MKGIIYYNSNFENGIAELKRIVERYKQMEISTTYCNYSRNGALATFENGDSWRVLGAKDSSRGYRCNVAYIERSIDYNTYQVIIGPAMFEFPYSAMRFWGEGNLHLNFDPPLPF